MIRFEFCKYDQVDKVVDAYWFYNGFSFNIWLWGFTCYL